MGSTHVLGTKTCVCEAVQIDVHDITTSFVQKRNVLVVLVAFFRPKHSHQTELNSSNIGARVQCNKEAGKCRRIMASQIPCALVIVHRLLGV